MTKESYNFGVDTKARLYTETSGMTGKRFTVLKKLENCDIEEDVIDTYIERLVKDGKSVGWVTVGILDKGNPITYKDCVDLLNENEQLRTKNNAYIQDIEVFKEENTQLKLENEQLKSDIYDWKASAEDYLKLGKSLKKENEQLKIALKDKENLISICEKKFKELGYLITCNDDGYVIE